MTNGVTNLLQGMGGTKAGTGEAAPSPFPSPVINWIYGGARCRELYSTQLWTRQ